MKGILVTTDNTVEIKDFEAPLYKTVGDAVGGYIEIVNPVGLARPLCMVIDDAGLIKEKPVNPIGSLLYGTHVHGSPIVGDIVIMKLGFTDEGLDIVGLDDQECEELMIQLREFFKKNAQ